MFHSVHSLWFEELRLVFRDVGGLVTIHRFSASSKPSLDDTYMFGPSTPVAVNLPVSSLACGSGRKTQDSDRQCSLGHCSVIS